MTYMLLMISDYSKLQMMTPEQAQSLDATVTGQGTRESRGFCFSRRTRGAGRREDRPSEAGTEISQSATVRSQQLAHQVAGFGSSRRPRSTRPPTGPRRWPSRTVPSRFVRSCRPVGPDVPVSLAAASDGNSQWPRSSIRTISSRSPRSRVRGRRLRRCAVLDHSSTRSRASVQSCTDIHIPRSSSWSRERPLSASATRRFEIDAGTVVVSPPNEAHGFTNTGTGELRLTSVHAAGRFATEWLVGMDPVWTSKPAK